MSQTLSSGCTSSPHYFYIVTCLLASNFQLARYGISVFRQFSKFIATELCAGTLSFFVGCLLNKASTYWVIHPGFFIATTDATVICIVLSDTELTLRRDDAI